MLRPDLTDDPKVSERLSSAGAAAIALSVPSVTLICLHRL